MTAALRRCMRNAAGEVLGQAKYAELPCIRMNELDNLELDEE
jgi:hypothetical protein